MNMRMRWLLATPLLMLCGCGGASWQEFTSTEGKFRVLMYGKPEEKSLEVDQKPARSFEVNPRKGVSYMVIYFDPTLDVKERDKPEYLEKVLSTLSVKTEETSKGKIESAKRVQLQKHPGQEVLIAAPSDVTIRVRYYLVNNRCYELVAAGPRDVVTGEEAEKFLNSFRPTE